MQSRQGQGQAMRRVRREQLRRRRMIRRRIAAVSALAVVVAAAVVALASAGGGSNPARARPAASRAGSGHTNHTNRTNRTNHASRDRSAVPRAPRAGQSTAATLTGGTGHPGSARVPILMYHVIAPPLPDAPYPGLYVPPAEFAAQMHALKAAGWVAVTLDQLHAYWAGTGHLPPGKPIVLTFDNGYHSQYSQALPVLHSMGWVADENMQLTGLPPSQGGLTTAEVQALVRAGWELDTQGISHADLATITPSELHDQVFSARAALRRQYHVPVNWFCYPSGQYDPAVIAAVRSAGYLGSTTVIPGWATPSEDSYRLPRLRVLGGTSPQALLDQIAAAQSSPPPPGSYVTS